MENPYFVNCFGDIIHKELGQIIAERDELDLLENAIEKAKKKL